MEIATPDFPLLEKSGTVTISATTDPFVVKDKFFVGKPSVGIAWLSDNFKAWFWEMIEEPTIEKTLCYAILTRRSLDGPIIAELGERKRTKLSQVFSLIELQPNGKEGALLSNGLVSVFYVQDFIGEFRTVHVCGSEFGWRVGAASVKSSFRWGVGTRVFSAIAQAFGSILSTSRG